MLRSMYSGISGMKVNQNKLDVVANNIANSTTTAFKGSSVRFTDMLYQNSSSASGATETLGGTNANQIGLGAKVSSINKVMSQGNILSTGRTLDVCIDGEGYLVVASGNIDGEIEPTDDGIQSTMNDVYYTRDGNLTLDDKGNLLTADGYRVMGYWMDGVTYEEDGKTGYTITGASGTEVDATGNLKPLVIPDKIDNDMVASFEIGSNGVITVICASGEKHAIGQIAMARFKNPEGLNDVGGNKATVSSNSGNPLIMTGKGIEGNSGGFGRFVQGGLEASNVDLTEQFTDMITATRAFQAASKMISNSNEILQTITNLV